MVRILAASVFGGFSWFTGATPQNEADIFQGLLAAALILAMAHLVTRGELSERG